MGHLVGLTTTRSHMMNKYSAFLDLDNYVTEV